MSEATDDADLMDAPNQQAVRPDGSAPWDEGTGGSGGETPRRGRGRPRRSSIPDEPEATGATERPREDEA
jgi:hypothetical protein